LEQLWQQNALIKPIVQNQANMSKIGILKQERRFFTAPAIIVLIALDI
jgi:hypothetical protein